ncbi:hypothetical protein [Paracoccus alkanivorans]|uniref:Uncharacterized protein n=1 Tax=Paracoccus alkanivorans TaxID=2116655 RepID=A0A3M0MEA4_9RHOB|nr:hypothetical protein [Paracoccus alkanivorans]RMC35433.1 hypothetical protein C9E81_09365 [Paracoccus alkanivorans]
MSGSLIKHLSSARAAIIAGDMELALDRIERFSTAAEKTPPDEATKEQLRSGVAELQILAEASLRGTRSAVDQIREIIQTARTLQTYDDTGQRQITSTVADMPHRF